MSERVPITIIGAGVVGCAIAYQLSKLNKEVFVIEKNPKVTSENQSSRNSGVVHAGVYYPKDEGPLKGELCVKGNKLLYDFCAEFDVPSRQTGKLIVAVNERELPYLQDTFDIACENGVPNAKLITGNEAKKTEPNVRCLKAAHVPTSGIVEATQLVHKLYTLANQEGAFFLTNTNVIDIRPKAGFFEITTQSGSRTEVFESEIVINSAGLYSDEIGKMVNPDLPFDILPIRGEAAKFYKTKREDIYHAGLNVYPVPFPIYPDGSRAELPFDEFKKLFNEKKVVKTVGVHLTPTFDMKNGDYEIGNVVTLGPAPKLAKHKEDYSEDLFEPQYYFDSVKNFFPNLRIEDISLHQAGIQAKLVQQYDWVIQPDEKHPKFIQLIGIDSPGLTACLSIADYVQEIIQGL